MFSSKLPAAGPSRTLDGPARRASESLARARNDDRTGDFTAPIDGADVAIREIARLLDESPETAAREMQRLIDEEMVLHLDDLILGRLDGVHLGPALLPLGQRIIAALAWNSQRGAHELARLESRLAAHLPAVRRET
jgi:hypothetical protein